MKKHKVDSLTKGSSRALDIVIPMAGRGSRFADAGYELPKPLVDVNGKPMIARVIDNLRPVMPHRFIFLVLQEHLENYQLEEKLTKWAGPQSVFVPVKAVTEGAACTVLLAREYLGKSDLVIANSDQLVDFKMSKFIGWSRESRADGSILVFEDNNEKWSFVRLGEQGNVVEVAEKKLISNLATVGIYYYKAGSEFVAAADRMIAKDIRVNGEFYVCPVFNEMIADHQRILTWKIEKMAMHGIGTPEDLQLYLASAR